MEMSGHTSEIPPPAQTIISDPLFVVALADCLCLSHGLFGLYSDKQLASSFSFLFSGVVFSFIFSLAIVYIWEMDGVENGFYQILTYA